MQTYYIEKRELHYKHKYKSISNKKIIQITSANLYIYHHYNKKIHIQKKDPNELLGLFLYILNSANIMIVH